MTRRPAEERRFPRGTVGENDAADLLRDLQREASLFVTDAVVERGIDLLGER